ncbi:VOC family protein [Dasania sp. GY-MA-18]|uniref:VOC family protein n=2 Tax=Dasania phycosphaerae TaxID=2950436 RepID=A0A9J6RNU2_9GAMM|nr:MULTISPECIES: VOC family protein [Dasania]MCR8923777.1 VOC family protein [Dasania sp. GY-MA-18]MCZ0866211.1 VOC family protein [Dasania phycosphaerae]MCZ0869935.1 VOC family protein [Dasania phycosphaerae]
MEHEKINYVEYAAHDIKATKQFFTKAFNWVFTDFGESYTAFTNAGLNGGFYQADKKSSAENGGALIVLYSYDLEKSYQKVKAAGGKISKEIFPFPGGRRFQFIEPSGNEFGVWSKEEAAS